MNDRTRQHHALLSNNLPLMLAKHSRSRTGTLSRTMHSQEEEETIIRKAPQHREFDLWQKWQEAYPPCCPRKRTNCLLEDRYDDDYELMDVFYLPATRAQLEDEDRSSTSTFDSSSSWSSSSTHDSSTSSSFRSVVPPPFARIRRRDSTLAADFCDMERHVYLPQSFARMIKEFKYLDNNETTGHRAGSISSVTTSAAQNNQKISSSSGKVSSYSLNLARYEHVVSSRKKLFNTSNSFSG